jgi:hypothetical protein
MSNFFYLSGISVLIYLISPLIAIFLNVKPLSDAYQSQWLAVYVPFVVTNFGLATALLKKHRISSLLLGIFTFVPYLDALRSTLLSVRQFKWRVTNARSKGLITKLLAPYIIFLCIAIAGGYFLATGILVYNSDLLLYYGWLAIDIIVVAAFITHSYAATSKTTLPILAGNLEEAELATAELLSVNKRIEKPAATGAMQSALADTPTTEVPSANGKSHVPLMWERLSRL